MISYQVPELDGYRDGTFVGAGGMAWIARYYSVAMQKDVAVKFAPDDENQALLQRELEIGTRLASDPDLPTGIVTPCGWGWHDGRLFLVFDWIDGPSLRTVIDRAQDSVSWRSQLQRSEVVVYLITQALRRVGYLHRNGLYCLDASPQNTLIMGDGRTMMIDFGTVMTRGVPVAAQYGTPDVAAPELIRGRAGPPADLYAVAKIGCAVAGSDAGPPAHLDQPLRDVLGRMLNEAPEHRPSAEQALAEIQGAVRDGCAERGRETLRRFLEYLDATDQDMIADKRALDKALAYENKARRNIIVVAAVLLALVAMAGILQIGSSATSAPLERPSTTDHGGRS